MAKPRLPSPCNLTSCFNLAQEDSDLLSSQECWEKYRVLPNHKSRTQNFLDGVWRQILSSVHFTSLPVLGLGWTLHTVLSLFLSVRERLTAEAGLRSGKPLLISWLLRRVYYTCLSLAFWEGERSASYGKQSFAGWKILGETPLSQRNILYLRQKLGPSRCWTLRALPSLFAKSFAGITRRVLDRRVCSV